MLSLRIRDILKISISDKNNRTLQELNETSETPDFVMSEFVENNEKYFSVKGRKFFSNLNNVTLKDFRKRYRRDLSTRDLRKLDSIRNV